MATGDFPDPEGMVWTDTCGWIPKSDKQMFIGPHQEIDDIDIQIIEACRKRVEVGARISVNGARRLINIINRLRGSSVNQK